MKRNADHNESHSTKKSHFTSKTSSWRGSETGKTFYSFPSLYREILPSISNTLPRLIIKLFPLRVRLVGSWQSFLVEVSWYLEEAGLGLWLCVGGNDDTYQVINILESFFNKKFHQHSLISLLSNGNETYSISIYPPLSKIVIYLWYSCELSMICL